MNIQYFCQDKMKGFVDLKSYNKLKEENQKLKESLDKIEKKIDENLRLKLCNGMTVNEKDGKIHCKEALKKQSYEKRKCEYCNFIDEFLKTIKQEKKQ